MMMDKMQSNANGAARGLAKAAPPPAEDPNDAMGMGDMGGMGAIAPLLDALSAGQLDPEGQKQLAAFLQQMLGSGMNGEMM